jgi:hypothetical protein
MRSLRAHKLPRSLLSSFKPSSWRLAELDVAVCKRHYSDEAKESNTLQGDPAAQASAEHSQDSSASNAFAESSIAASQESSKPSLKERMQSLPGTGRFEARADRFATLRQQQLARPQIPEPSKLARSWQKPDVPFERQPMPLEKRKYSKKGDRSLMLSIGREVTKDFKDINIRLSSTI